MHLASLGMYNKSPADIVMPIHISISELNYVTNSPMKIGLQQHDSQS